MKNFLISLLSIIAMVKSGVVDNVVVWDKKTPWNPGAEYTLVDLADYDGVGPGCSYDKNDKSFLCDN